MIESKLEKECDFNDDCDSNFNVFLWILDAKILIDIWIPSINKLIFILLHITS